ncbi:MAG: deoxyribonuclease IV [Clostridia bacterium]|nr:deoxyribonuclease IV [Clostridia bacterium]
MFYIGCHLSSSSGYLHMAKEAVSIGANTFQFFTRNPRGGAVKAQDPADVKAYVLFAAQNGIDEIIAHAPYTLNPCSKDEGIREFTANTMLDDLAKLENVPGALYNFHPGSHVGQGIDAGIEMISATLKKLLSNGFKTPVLLETMSGKGSEVGGRFEEIKAIIDSLPADSNVGVCLDTCHVYDAGYDVVNDLDGVLAEFDKIIGLRSLRAVHLNDTKNPFSSHKDRHEKIGEGYIGTEGFRRIVNHPALEGLPFCLETPQEDVAGYGREIGFLKSLRQPGG